MSVQAMSWVFDHSESTKGDRLVLLAVANHADADGENAWAGVDRLAEEARLSRRQVQYALRRLENLGEIEATGRHVPPSGRADRATMTYRLPGLRGAKSAPRDAERGALHDLDGAHSSAPEPSLEPSEDLDPAATAAGETSRRAQGKALAGYLRERLTARGVTVFPRDFHLTGAAVAERMLAAATLEEIVGCIDWALEHPWWSTRTTRMEKVRDVMPEYQQRDLAPAERREAKSRAREILEQAGALPAEGSEDGTSAGARSDRGPGRGLPRPAANA